MACYLLPGLHLIRRLQYVLSRPIVYYRWSSPYLRLQYFIQGFNNILFYTTALFPHFSHKVLGFYRGWSRAWMPSYGENINFLLPSHPYYCVTSVQVFIIYPGREDCRQLLHRRFLPLYISWLSRLLIYRSLPHIIEQPISHHSRFFISTGLCLALYNNRSLTIRSFLSTCLSIH